MWPGNFYVINCGGFQTFFCLYFANRIGLIKRLLWLNSEIERKIVNFSILIEIKKKINIFFLIVFQMAPLQSDNQDKMREKWLWTNIKCECTKYVRNFTQNTTHNTWFRHLSWEFKCAKTYIILNWNENNFQKTQLDAYK